MLIARARRLLFNGAARGLVMGAAILVTLSVLAAPAARAASSSVPFTWTPSSASGSCATVQGVDANYTVTTEITLAGDGPCFDGDTFDPGTLQIALDFAEGADQCDNGFVPDAVARTILANTDAPQTVMTALPGPGTYNVCVVIDGEGAYPLIGVLVIGSGQSSSCTQAYQTVVTEHAGGLTLPGLFTDTVTFDWCTDGNGGVQVSSSSQAPTVQKSGLSSSGAQIALLNAIGITFNVTPATVPEPTIDNEGTTASTFAEGLSFNGQFNAGPAVASAALGLVTDGLGAELVPLIRSGQLGRVSALLLERWSSLAAAVQAYAVRNFGLPAWAAKLLASFSLGKIKSALTGLAGQFVTTTLQLLQALGHNPTVASVVNAVKSAAKLVASSLIFTTVLWAPQITALASFDGSPSVTVGSVGTVASGITVAPATETTTPES